MTVLCPCMGTEECNRINPYARVYLAWWPEHNIVKFGRCWKMSRVREFERRGAHVLELSDPMLRIAELRVLHYAKQRFQPAFRSAKEAEELGLMWRGRGWTECFVVPYERMQEAMDVFVEGICWYVHQSAEALAWRRLHESGPDPAPIPSAASGDISTDDVGLVRARDSRSPEDPSGDLAGRSGGSGVARARRGGDVPPAPRRGEMADPLHSEQPVPLPDHRPVAPREPRTRLHPPTTPELAESRGSTAIPERSSRGRAREGERGRERAAAGARRRDFDAELATVTFAPDSPASVLQCAQGWTPGGCGLSRLRHCSQPVWQASRSQIRTCSCRAARPSTPADRPRSDRRRAERTRGGRRRRVDRVRESPRAPASAPELSADAARRYRP